MTKLKLREEKNLKLLSRKNLRKYLTISTSESSHRTVPYLKYLRKNKQ